MGPHVSKEKWFPASNAAIPGTKHPVPQSDAEFSRDISTGFGGGGITVEGDSVRLYSVRPHPKMSLREEGAAPH